MGGTRRVRWTEVARRLAQVIPKERLHPGVRSWAAGRTRSAHERWAVACSGGADSVALLLLIWAHWPERAQGLLVLHFDHALRGAASRGDERFCRKLATALGCDYQSTRWAGARAQVSEATLREARLQFFEAAMKRSGCRALWLGHQADDVAETLLMRIARGSGAAGLAAPRPVQRLSSGSVRVRPLLALGRDELRAELKSAGGVWRDDESNKTGRFFRNRIRSDVLPIWRGAVSDRDALTGACLSRELLEEDDEALRVWLEEIGPLRRRGVLDLKLMQDKPRALWRRAIHGWLLSSGYQGDLSKRGFDLLLEAAMRGVPTRQSMGREGFAVIAGNQLRYVNNLRRRTQK
ncbi:tRNA(Ile)-lysidine synthase [mine drainage metagenome]|uniref:tRNA(Ile)-lysidine synthetase n=1 Tax=mine drainage metagenome TaxID=410659 RepID=A0A1J5TIN8_9ZZZZ